LRDVVPRFSTRSTASCHDAKYARSVHVYARSEGLATAKYVSERIGPAEEIVPIESRSQSLEILGKASVARGQLRCFRPLFTPQASNLRRIRTHYSFIPASTQHPSSNESLAQNWAMNGNVIGDLPINWVRH